MCLLETSWGDFAAWFQAIIALVALILTGFTIFTTKKVRELSDIVIELSNQTKELKAQTSILLKSFELEQFLSAKERMPYFEFRYLMNAEDSGYTLGLKNSGMDALNLKILPLVNFIDGMTNIELAYEDTVPKGRGIDFNISCIRPISERNLSFSFTMEYNDSPGATFFQQIICVEGKVRVAPPTTKKRVSQK